MSFELFYSTGGHGGPYPTLEGAIARAVRLLDTGNESGSIQVRASSTAREAICTVRQFAPPIGGCYVDWGTNTPRELNHTAIEILRNEERLDGPPPINCPHCLEIIGQFQTDLFQHLRAAHHLPERESREVAREFAVRPWTGICSRCGWSTNSETAFDLHNRAHTHAEKKS
jgi:hypothetical protein